MYVLTVWFFHVISAKHGYQKYAVLQRRASFNRLCVKTEAGNEKPGWIVVMGRLEILLSTCCFDSFYYRQFLLRYRNDAAFQQLLAQLHLSCRICLIFFSFEDKQSWCSLPGHALVHMEHLVVAAVSMPCVKSLKERAVFQTTQIKESLLPFAHCPLCSGNTIMI